MKGSCAYCEQAATTLDHIPPRAIFPRPRPNDLITVPACEICNGSASVDDERFRVMISLAAGADTPVAERLFADGVRSIRHNRKLRRDVVDSVERVFLASPGGVIYDDAYRVPWDTPTANRVQTRIVRGLYFNHSGTRLPPSDIKVRFFHRLSRNLLEIANRSMALGKSVGDGQFVYRGQIVTDGESVASAWILQYHNRSWHGVTTHSV